MTNPMTSPTLSALKQYNSDFGAAWSPNMQWSNVGTGFETFVNKYLFPKISETNVISIALGNRFDWLAKEIDFVSQYSEEYVILDSVPINLNLSSSAELMLKRNYPKMATVLYGQGAIKRQKFTLNNNDVRHNFLTLKDAIGYALAVYKKRLSDINVEEEREVKATLLNYALNQTKTVRTVNSQEELFSKLFEAILNMQNNSEKYNEADTASGGQLGRYTTVSRLEDFAILTSDKMKTFLLDSKLANTYQVAGIDLSSKIMSFDDLGGCFKTTEEITISSEDTLNYIKSFGDYQVAIGSIVPEGAVFTFDVSGLTEFKTKVEEIKPQSELFAYVFDINKLKYRRSTKGMLKQPFYNGETDEVTYWLHYYSFKSMSPFYNSILVKGE